MSIFVVICMCGIEVQCSLLVDKNNNNVSQLIFVKLNINNFMLYLVNNAKMVLKVFRF